MQTQPSGLGHRRGLSRDNRTKGGIAVGANKDPNSLPSKSSKILRIGNFRLGKTVGVGSFGKVKIAEHVVTGHKVAVKILNRKKIKTLRMDLKIKREITNMKLFRHPHIIRLYEVIETPTDIFMVMEFVPGGELFDYIVTNGKLSEDAARRFFQQIISGVEYCHSHMVVHRDLKPENLLVDPKNSFVKIADFGLSTMMQDGDFLKTSCGSPNYAAPEVISGKLYAGPEVDIWSCGVILYTLLCARLPFDDEYIPALFKKIRAGAYEQPMHVSASCRDLISAMLVVDPLKRITVAEIRAHPWFQQDLPKYLMPQAAPKSILENLDDEIIQEIVTKFGVDEKTVIQAINTAERKGEPNEFIVAYHLIYDNKKLIPEKDRQTLQSNLAALATSPINLREEVPFEVDEKENSSKSPTTDIEQGISDEQTKKKMWYLGLMTSVPPEEAMKEVFRALRVNNFEWKIVGPYQLRCRHSDPDSSGEVKIALQLYKVKEKRYLLDVKKLSGETFPFFDNCSKLLNEMNL
eukprot:TRINITY_DN4783_c0_g3_i1.p1 TRINITY_DN4783_c0_g3~~TRINITY_DN4783_c0_g3_i1.p1  ORF type:complete len:520 (-),score=183.32 TRINITY_DN4783_c0_g3_i1:28-1587(-)